METVTRSEDLAKSLLRTVARTFYSTEHVLVIDALLGHSTLPDIELQHVLSMQIKPLRKLCGRLREDGLLSVETRAERKTDGSQMYYGSKDGQVKERITHRDWYYLNYHRAIDCIKYRMYRLNKHIEIKGAPSTEKKDLFCPRCKNQYTDLEAMDNLDITSGTFRCKRCGHALENIKTDERTSENESMKRLNNQLEKILRLMQQIDATTVPENDFDMALRNKKDIIRAETHPGQQNTQSVDLPGKGLESSKGLAIKPEKIAVEVQDDETVKREKAAAESQARRDQEAKQNALPEWIATSTITRDLTAVGAKEQKQQREREANATGARGDEGDEKKGDKDGDKDVMDAYFKELARAEEAARVKSEEDDEEEEEEEDDDEELYKDFEDVGPNVNGLSGTTMSLDASRTASNTNVNTPVQLESSNGTDDERDTKRVRIDDSSAASLSVSHTNDSGSHSNPISQRNEGTPGASDEDDDDDDELEFENV